MDTTQSDVHGVALLFADTVSAPLGTRTSWIVAAVEDTAGTSGSSIDDDGACIGSGSEHGDDSSSPKLLPSGGDGTGFEKPDDNNRLSRLELFVSSTVTTMCDVLKSDDAKPLPPPTPPPRSGAAANAGSSLPAFVISAASRLRDNDGHLDSKAVVADVGSCC